MLNKCSGLREDNIVVYPQGNAKDQHFKTEIDLLRKTEEKDQAENICLNREDDVGLGGEKYNQKRSDIFICYNKD